MKKIILKRLSKKILQNIKIHNKLLNLNNVIFKSINQISKSLKNNGKIMLCGNGGSAADAQHLAAEFLVRLRPKVNRKPLPAITLAQDPSTITAVSNDYDFKYLFSRNLRALAKKNDVLIAISTSGNSKNIIEVLKEAKKLKIKSIALLGCGGGIAKKFTDYPIVVESNNTASIQETHIFLGHFIFENVEDIILNRNISS